MGDFSHRQDWREHRQRGRIGIPDGKVERARINESLVAEYYDIPYVATCPALHQTMNRTESDPLRRIKDVDEMINVFVPDTVHLSELGGSMQACFFAQLTLPRDYQYEQDSLGSQESHDMSDKSKIPTEPKLPPPLYLSSIDDESHHRFCMKAKEHTLTPSVADGWRLMENSGNGGRKSWYAAERMNATVVFRTPTASFLKLLVYRHPDLPLGRVRVDVAVADEGKVSLEMPPQFIDPCCSGTTCPGAGAGFGKNEEIRVPETGLFPTEIVAAQEIDISITVVPREEATECTEDGTDFSLIQVVGRSIQKESE